jgi:lipoprotein NlpD
MSRAVLLLLLAAAACGAPSRPQFPVPMPDRPAASTPSPSPVARPRAKPRPPWRAARVVADAVEVAEQSVAVRPGDTLSAIGERTGSSVQAIASANGIAPPFVIEPGQRLRIPAGRYHTVKAGETGIAIARAYTADWDAVIAVNELKAPYTLRVGQRLRLPSQAAARTMTLAERAAAFSIDIDDLISGSEPATTAGATESETAAATVAPAPLPPAPPFDGRFAPPLEGRIVSRFGPKESGRRNDGVNIRATAGTPIRAAADGIVAYAGDGIEGFGNLVLIKHAGGWVTAYAHAQDVLVVRGDTVRRGDPIARVGSTGSVDEPQLHFEIRQGRKPVDPLAHLPGLG